MFLEPLLVDRTNLYQLKHFKSLVISIQILFKLKAIVKKYIKQSI